MNFAEKRATEILRNALDAIAQAGLRVSAHGNNNMTISDFSFPAIPVPAVKENEWYWIKPIGHNSWSAAKVAHRKYVRGETTTFEGLMMSIGASDYHLHYVEFGPQITPPA